MTAGFTWEANGSSVLESSAALPDSIGLNGGPEFVSGLLQFEGTTPLIPMGTGSTAVNRKSTTPPSTSAGRRVLRDAGATHITVLRDRDTLVVLQGQSGPATLVYVYSSFEER